MKIKGTLKMERNTIVTLLIISIATLCASACIEFVVQAFISEYCYTELHLAFVTNVMLGIAGSATISLLCLIFPYLEKKNSQEAKIVNLVRKVYCDYARLITTISSNFAREETDNSYIGEYQLKRDIQQLSQSIVQLCDQYGQMEITSDGIDQIVAKADNITALTEVVDHFLALLSASGYRQADCIKITNTYKVPYFCIARTRQSRRQRICLRHISFRAVKDSFN